jgi:hypothetical protein
MGDEAMTLGTVNFLVNDQQKHGLKEIKDSTKRENSQVGRLNCAERGPVCSKRISNIISKKE